MNRQAILDCRREAGSGLRRKYGVKSLAIF